MPSISNEEQMPEQSEHQIEQNIEKVRILFNSNTVMKHHRIDKLSASSINYQSRSILIQIFSFKVDKKSLHETKEMQINCH